MKLIHGLVRDRQLLPKSMRFAAPKDSSPFPKGRQLLHLVLLAACITVDDVLGGACGLGPVQGNGGIGLLELSKFHSGF